jgi:protein subunit release factor B
MAETLVITPRIAIPLAELEFSFARSGGPGGQNVNKVSSKAILHYDITRSASIPDDVRQRALAQFASRINNEGKLVISCDTSASQHKNREECIAHEHSQAPRRKGKALRQESLAPQRLERGIVSAAACAGWASA